MVNWINDLIDVRNNLVRKRLVPDEYRKLLYDPQYLRASINNYPKEAFQEHICPDCMISIRAPKQWVIAHHKQCKGVYRDKMRENEALTTGFHPYKL